MLLSRGEKLRIEAWDGATWPEGAPGAANDLDEAAVKPYFRSIAWSRRCSTARNGSSACDSFIAGGQGLSP